MWLFVIIFCCSFMNCFCLFFIFFFKQKPAYEMRISDWISDVCSSDLALLAATACPIRPLAAYMAAAEAKGRDVMVHPRGKIMMMMRTVVFLIAPGMRCGVGSATRKPSAGANMTR